jgi:transglutaminase-like putative cysteine protease
MLLNIQHETRLTYSEPVCETVFEVRMSPPSDDDQTNLGYRLRITPAAPVTSYRDGFGNRVDLFNVLEPYRELVIRATTVARTHRRDGAARLAEAGSARDASVPLEALEYLQPSPLVGPSAELAAFVASIALPDDQPLPDVVQSIVGAVRERLAYEKKVTTARTPVGEVLSLGRGVCQDFTHLFLGACRTLGLPARYVSGYVDGTGELATHAWCQVWADRVGWVDVDPTRGIFPDDHYVVTALGRDYSDVPPNRGVWKGLADETITVVVKIEPIDRVPPNWSEWGNTSPPPGESWSQQSNRPRRAPGPSLRTAYRQQQSQQQQSGPITHTRAPRARSRS